MGEETFTNFNEYRCLVQLICSAINKTAADFGQLQPNWRILYQIAKGASLLSLVSYGIAYLPPRQKPNKEVQEKFLQSRTQGIVQDSNQIYELELLKKAFEEQHIDHLLIKGSVIKQEYPQTDMRFMGDIDILVKPEAKEKAEEVLLQLGYSVFERGREKHDQYIKKPFALVELHRSLVERNKKEFSYFSKVWDNAELQKEFKHSYILTKEETYIFMTVHAVKHFYIGGISIGILLDYYVYLNKYKDTLNFEYIHKVLEQFNYVSFEEKMRKMAYDWFSPNGLGLQNNAVTKYILGSGTYGNMQNNIAIRMAMQGKEGKNPSTLRFIRKQVFPSKEKLAARFPILEKAPVLLPFIWVRLAFTRVFIKRKKTMVTNPYGMVSAQQIENMRKINRDLGLEEKTK